MCQAIQLHWCIRRPRSSSAGSRRQIEPERIPTETETTAGLEPKLQKRSSPIYLTGHVSVNYFLALFVQTKHPLYHKISASPVLIQCQPFVSPLRVKTWEVRKVLPKLTRYPNSMVESRAWMMDHKPQKKWDAKENLFSNIRMGGHCLFPTPFHSYRLVVGVV